MHQKDEMLDIERQSVGKDLWELADAIAYRRTYRSELRKRLMAQARALDAERKEVRTLGTASQDKGEARSPSSWFQRLAPDVGRIEQILERGLTMKKGFALAAAAALIIAVSTVAFTPSVRAQVGEIFNTWFRIETPGGAGEVAISGTAEFVPLHPTYLPAGLQSVGFTTSGGKSESSESIELMYHNEEQFLTIAQSKAPVDKALPAGLEVIVNGQPAVLVTDLKGTFGYGLRIPEGAHVVEETIGTPPARPIPYHGSIAYTEGKRLTWYVGDVKIEMLSNLSEAEMLKVAESLVPAETGEGKPPFQPPLDIPSGSEEKVIETDEGGHIIIRRGSTESNP